MGLAVSAGGKGCLDCTVQGVCGCGVCAVSSRPSSELRTFHHMCRPFVFFWFLVLTTTVLCGQRLRTCCEIHAMLTMDTEMAGYQIHSPTYSPQIAVLLLQSPAECLVPRHQPYLACLGAICESCCHAIKSGSVSHYFAYPSLQFLLLFGAVGSTPKGFRR